MDFLLFYYENTGQQKTPPEGAYAAELYKAGSGLIPAKKSKLFSGFISIYSTIYKSYYIPIPYVLQRYLIRIISYLSAGTQQQHHSSTISTNIVPQALHRWHGMGGDGLNGSLPILYEVEKRKALTLDQQELFLRYIKETEKYQHWYPIFFIMLNTGMRVGEITGLRWRDVDFEQGFINVNHTLVYYNHRDELGAYFSINTPKTDAGKRDIPMIEGVREAFEMERQWLVQEHIRK